jgi:hypothetical protein
MQLAACETMRSSKRTVSDLHHGRASMAGKHVIDLTVSENDDGDENDMAGRQSSFKAATVPSDPAVGKAGSKRKEVAI